MSPSGKRASRVLGVPLGLFPLALAFPSSRGGLFLWSHALAARLPEDAWLYRALHTGIVVQDKHGKTLLARFGADLTDLSGAVFDLTGADLRGAVYTDTTVWPDGFTPPAVIRSEP